MKVQSGKTLVAPEKAFGGFFVHLHFKTKKMFYIMRVKEFLGTLYCLNSVTDNIVLLGVHVSIIECIESLNVFIT